MQRRDRGLTLVEILTVVAILLVLGGIVFMATRPARMAGLVKSSQGQMRQIWVAMSLYAADNNGGEHPELYGLVLLDRPIAQLTPYGVDNRLLCCPGAPREFCDKFRNTYGMGPLLINNDPQIALKLIASNPRFPTGAEYPAVFSENFDDFFIYPNERDIPLDQARPYIAWVGLTGGAHARRVPPPRSIAQRRLLGLD